MLFDLHNDYLTANREERAAAELDSNGLSAVIFAVWASRAKYSEAEFFTLTKSIPDCACRRMTAIEDIGSMSIDDYGAFLDKARPAYISLTWNGENKLAGGVGSNGGLTDEGRAVLDAMESRDIVLDLAHLNERSFWQALEYYGGRVIVSHTGIKDVYASERNLSFGQMCGVWSRKGIIGIFAAAKFLTSGDCTADDYAAHIMKAVSAVGTSTVCIGTDFCGTDRYPEGFCGYGGHTLLREKLATAGLKNNDIDKILHINAERFFGIKENE